jgi:hypothetical protein
MEFTSGSIKTFRAEFRDAVAELEKKHGISINIGNIKYNPTKFTTKLEVIASKPDEDGNVVTGEQANFNANCAHVGLSPQHYKATFTHRRSDYILVGVKPRNRKYPIIAQDVISGRNYKLTREPLEDIILGKFIQNI